MSLPREEARGEEPEDRPDTTTGEPPLTGDALRIVTLLRQLRAAQAERDAWMTEALALRKRLGMKPERDRWRKPAAGFRRVWLDDGGTSLEERM